MDLKKLLNPTFVAAAAVLAAGSMFVYAWVAVNGLHPIKEPVPLQAPIQHDFPDEFDVDGQTYIRISEAAIPKEVLSFLFDGGMGEDDDYLQWFLIPENEARTILKDKKRKIERNAALRDKWKEFASANLDDPLVLRSECDATRHPELMGARHLVNLFITYYTGKADTVPHIPERCYLGAGFKQTGDSMLDVPCPGIQWGQRDGFRVKFINFHKRAVGEDGQLRDERTHVTRFFIANWKYMNSRVDVRLTQADPTQSEVFFTKIEVKFNNLGQSRIDPLTGRTLEADQDELKSSLRKFLAAVAPIYERSFLPLPSWQRDQE